MSERTIGGMKIGSATNPTELRKEITENYEVFKNDSSYRKSCEDRLKSMDVNKKQEYSLREKNVRRG